MRKYKNIKDAMPIVLNAEAVKFLKQCLNIAISHIYNRGEKFDNLEEMQQKKLNIVNYYNYINRLKSILKNYINIISTILKNVKYFWSFGIKTNKIKRYLLFLKN